MAISVKKNIFYSLLYQVLSFVIPFVTSPYIARVLGPTQIGIYSYTYSVAYYFMMLVMLGIMNYGTRCIAKVRNNKNDLNKTFWSIYSIQLFMFFVSITLYLFYCFARNSEYFIVELCQSLFILSFGLDITWFFNGKESFKLIAVRNGIVKILNAVLIFLVVQTASDIWKYTLIMSGCTMLGQFIQWPFLLQELNFVKLKLNDITRHLKGVLVLFVPVLAISIFVYMDKIMIGKLSNMAEAGFYENSEKIISAPKAIIQAVGTVMLPHTANLFATGQVNKVYKSIRDTMYAVLWVTCGSVYSVAAVAPIFSVFFWGANFARCSDVISVISISLLFSCFGNVIRTQYLISIEKDKEYTASLIIGAVVNLCVNYLLIGKYGAVGAAIGTVAAEFALCFYQVWSVRDDLEIGNYIRYGIPFAIIGSVLFIISRFVLKQLPSNAWSLIGLILFGGLAYVVLSLLYMKFSCDELTKEMYKKVVAKIYKTQSKE